LDLLSPHEHQPGSLHTESCIIRWDEKAGLHGMRYAPNNRRARGTREKETGDEED
jgi:hypothetical protein